MPTLRPDAEERAATQQDAPLVIVKPRQAEGDVPASTSQRQPPTDPQLRVLHHVPGRYLVVVKPVDVRMDGDFTHTVEKLVMRYCQQTDPAVQEAGFGPRFVQRLDYATSGVMVVALARLPASVVSAQLEARTAAKRYLALVHGKVWFEGGRPDCVIDAPIADGLPNGSYHMMVGVPGREGRPARTHVSVVKHGAYYGAAVSKLVLRPTSGRRHQLRVHLKHGGWPIVGDATYAESAGASAFGGRVLPRMMLHAWQLDVRLAVTEELYGRKSALRGARSFEFDGGDPFCDMDGLRLWDVDNGHTTAAGVGVRAEDARAG